MPTEKQLDRIRKLIKPYRISDGKNFKLKNIDPEDTGDFDKTITAVQCLDHQLGELYEQVVEKMNGTLYITADHGNAEQMWDEKTNQPWTAHTTNPVPFLWITKKEQGNNTQLPLQQLRDIAPFILKNMGIEVPTEMKK